jgi:hypothetical protein
MPQQVTPADRLASLEDEVAALKEQNASLVEAFTALALRVDQATQVEEIIRRAASGRT